jgi:hypothetical protein
VKGEILGCTEGEYLPWSCGQGILFENLRMIVIFRAEQVSLILYQAIGYYENVNRYSPEGR